MNAGLRDPFGGPWIWTKDGPKYALPWSSLILQRLSEKRYLTNVKRNPGSQKNVILHGQPSLKLCQNVITFKTLNQWHWCCTKSRNFFAKWEKYIYLKSESSSNYRTTFRLQGLAGQACIFHDLWLFQDTQVFKSVRIKVEQCYPFSLVSVISQTNLLKIVYSCADFLYIASSVNLS